MSKKLLSPEASRMESVSLGESGNEVYKLDLVPALALEGWAVNELAVH